jgi:hypothetical protein
VREVRLETVLVDNGGVRVAADVSSALLVGFGRMTSADRVALLLGSVVGRVEAL